MPTNAWGDALHLTRALFAQDRIWVTAKSEVLKIDQMAQSHALNTLLMLERLPDLGIRNLQETPLYCALKRRALRPDPLRPDPLLADFRFEFRDKSLYRTILTGVAS